MQTLLTWLVSPILLVGALTSSPCDEDDPDDCWMSYLNAPPQDAIRIARNLSDRADTLADALPASLNVTGDFDVSISGGGDYDGYYMGLAMVFSRTKNLRQHRFTGASAGGMMPFELVLKGENVTLLTHLSYGVLTKLYPKHFSNEMLAGAVQDHHWRLMASWQTKTYTDSLASLDNKVFLALSCLDPILPKLVIVSNFTSKGDQATHAFMATGTVLETYDGKVCSDGGAMSGPNMTPLFQDGLRPQIIVDLMHTGFPTSDVFKVVLDDYIKMIRLGQDEAVEFLRTGKVTRDSKSITLCPKGAKVEKNVCELSAPLLV